MKGYYLSVLAICYTKPLNNKMSYVVCGTMIENAINQAYDILSEKHSTKNPSVLFDVIKLKALGFSNTEIATKVNKHRETVRVWIDELEKMNEEDKNIVLLGAMSYSCSNIEAKVRK